MQEIKTPEIEEIKKPEPENFRNIQPENGMTAEKAKDHCGCRRTGACGSGAEKCHLCERILRRTDDGGYRRYPRPYCGFGQL